MNELMDYFSVCTYILMPQFSVFFFFFSGLKEYIEANPAFSLVSPTTVVQSKISDLSTSSELLDVETADEFYDAMGGDSSSSDDDENSDNDSEAKNNVLVFPLVFKLEL